MLQLYDINKDKIDGLTKYKDLSIESVLLTGDKTLSFLYPSKLISGIVEEGYIRTKTDEFVIKEISDQGEWKSVKAQMNVEDLEGKPLEHFNQTEQTIENCIMLACAGTDWTVQVNNITKKRTVRKTNCSSWDLIQEAKKIYRVEIEFDTLNKVVKVYEKLGSDKGVYFSDELNLKALDIQSNSYDFYTRIKPIGKDDLKINVNGKDYLENYQYSSKVKTLIWKDERYTKVESLIEDGTAKLEELSKPYKAYKADIIDLASISEKYKNILNYKLGDTITLVSKDKRIKEKQRIVKIIEYPDEPSKNTCEIANTILSFEDIQKEFQDTTDTVNNITTDNGTVDGNTIDSIKTEQISDFEVSVAKITNLSVINASIANLQANKADIGSLNAVTIRVGALETTTAKITDLTVINASIANLQANKANVTDLVATNIKFNVASGGTLDLQTLLSKFVTGESGQFLNLTSSNTVIANAVIKDTIAANISVQDLKAGNIDANRFNIVGTNGNLLIKDNTIQIKDSTRVRVQIGKDASNDYNMYVWDSTGKLMFDATGLKADGIKSKIIRDDMVSDNANISGSKINISSLISEFNKDTNTTLMKASKIAFDSTGQSLEVSFNSLKSDVDGLEIGGRNLCSGSDFGGIPKRYERKNGGATEFGYMFTPTVQVANNTDYTLTVKIKGKANLNLYQINSGGNVSTTFVRKKDISETEYRTYSLTFKVNDGKTLNEVYICTMYGESNTLVGDWFELEPSTLKLEKGNKVTDWTPAPEDVDNKIQANTTSITAVQGQISGLISENTITKGDVTTLKNNYISIDATVKGLSSTVASHASSIGTLNTNLNTVSTKVTTVENKQATLEQNLEGFKTTVSNTYSTKTELNTTNSNVSSLSSRVNTAESSITQLNNKIALKVEQTDITNAINNLSIGGRNLVLDTGFKNLWSIWNTTKSSVAATESGQKLMFNDIAQSALLSALIEKLVKGEKYTLSFEARGNLNKTEVYIITTTSPNSQVFAKVGVINESSYTKITFTFSYSSDNISNKLFIGGTSSLAGQWIEIKKNSIKIEKGDKATDWTPAPEDVDQSIASVDGKVSTLNTTVSTVSNKVSTIETNLTSITQRVSSTESSISTHTTQINAVDGKISTAKTEAINSASTDATNKSNSALSNAKSYTDTQITTVNTTINNKVAEIKTTTDSITSRVSSTESSITTINGNVSGLTTRMNSAEQKITPTAITATISSAINDGTSSINTTQFIMDNTGFTIKNGALTIKNKAGATVFQGDANGNLKLSIFNSVFEMSATGARKTTMTCDVLDKFHLKVPYQNNGAGFLLETDTGLKLIEATAGTDYLSIPAYVKMSSLTVDNSANVAGDFAIKKAKFTHDSNGKFIINVPFDLKNEGFLLKTSTNRNLIEIISGGDGALNIPIWTRLSSLSVTNEAYIAGNFSVGGSKNSLQKTEHYGERLINAYETAEYYFSDLGFGKINENGECYINIDDILQECINLDCKYHIFTQIYNGSISIIDRHRNYFIVYGEPNTEFSWQYVAKRLGYENVRLDTPEIKAEPQQGIENILMEELTFNLEDLLLEEVV